MKKTTFLKGFCAKLALAVVAFGAVLSSCTKEEFNVQYKANKAQIYFNPVVIDAATTSLVVGATITGNDPIEGTPDIKAGSRTIAATYNGVSGEAIVTYGNIPAGSVVTYSPVILLNAEYQINIINRNAVEIEHITGNGTQGHTHSGSVWNINSSDYFAKFVASWDFTRKNQVISKEILASSVDLNKYISALNEVSVNVKGKEEFMVSAWAMYRADLFITKEDVTYEVSTKTTGDVVATVVVREAAAQAKCELIERAIPGHEGHYHKGHGHGESTNAGGGITWAE